MTLVDACQIVRKDILKNRAMGDGRYKGKCFQPTAKVSKARRWLIKNGYRTQLYQKESKMLNITRADEPIEDKCKAAENAAALITAENEAVVERYAARPAVRIEDEAVRPPEIVSFLDDIISVCVKHGMSISHEDAHGGFMIEQYKHGNIEWLKEAGDYR